MRETPLITFTKADDSGCGTRDPGDLDYIVHADALSRWLGGGNVHRGEDVKVRAAALAAELMAMAAALTNDAHPLTVSMEKARKRYAERVREWVALANAVVHE